MSTAQSRYQILDFTRGIAIILMFIFHLCFGLAQLGILKINFSTDGLWIGFRAIIVFLFLSLVGIGLVLANDKGIKLKSFIKRQLLLAVYAGLITLLSYMVRPASFVFFGILHLIFVASLLALLFIRFNTLNLILGLFTVALGLWLTIPQLDTRQFSWIGFSEMGSSSDDLAPIFPWFGLVLVGLFLGKLLIKYKNKLPLLKWNASFWLTQLISWMGRYSIHIYFIHFQSFYLLVYFFG